MSVKLLWKKTGKWQEAMYKPASHNSEGRLCPQGRRCMYNREIIGDLKMRKMRRYGSASDKRRRASCTSMATCSDWDVEICQAIWMFGICCTQGCMRKAKELYTEFFHLFWTNEEISVWVLMVELGSLGDDGTSARIDSHLRRRSVWLEALDGTLSRIDLR